MSSGNEILSRQSKLILNECALQWVILGDSKGIIFFNVLVSKFKQGHLPIGEIYTWFQNNRTITKDIHLIRLKDCELIIHTFEVLHKALLSQIQKVLFLIHTKSVTPEHSSNILDICTFMLTDICEDWLWLKEKPEYKNKELLKELVQNEIWEASTLRYREIDELAKKEFPDETQEALRLSKLIQTIKSDVSKYATFFPNVFLGDGYIHLVAGDSYLKNANGEIQNIQFFSKDDPISDMLDLYRVTRDFYDLCEEYGLASVKSVDIDSLFAPYIMHWLTQTDSKWIEWVKRAYEVDQANNFEPVLPPVAMNSASVLDLFRSFQSGLNFMAQFRFRDTKKKGQLARSFIIAMSKALQEYATLTYSAFKDLEATRDNLSSLSKEHCIRSNNLFAAQVYLRNVLDELKETEDSHTSISSDAKMIEPLKGKKSFEIKFMRAQNISCKNFMTPNPFIVVKIGDKLIGSTSVLDKTANPVWNEVTKVEVYSRATVEQARIHLTVFHDNSLGKEIPCGTASFSALDEKFEDCLSHDLTFDLSPGLLMVRIRRIGEIDDTKWFMDRAEELIRFSVEDMICIFIKKICDLVRYHFQEIFARAAPSSFWGVSLKQAIVVTDASIEEALQPLLEALNKNLTLLNKYIDRRFEYQLAQLYPVLVTENVQPVNIQSTEVQEGEFNTDNAPLLVNLVWHEILLLFETMLLEHTPVDNSQVMLTEQNKMRSDVIERMIEYLKSLFYCQLESGEVHGLKLSQLETDKYIQLRLLLDQHAKAGLVISTTTNADS